LRLASGALALGSCWSFTAASFHQRPKTLTSRLRKPRSGYVWRLPHPPWPLLVAESTFEVFRSSPTRNNRGDHLETAIVNFALLQCASTALARRPHPPKSMRLPNLLSWSFVCPSTDSPSAQVSPTAARGQLLCAPGANRMPCSAFVVSLHRDGLLCAPAPGVLQPGTGHGVHCVSASREPKHQTNPAFW
jgi:hypothetical protein